MTILKIDTVFACAVEDLDMIVMSDWVEVLG